MILAGFCLPPLLDNILGLTEPDLANALEGEGKAEEKTEGPQRTKARLVGGVLLGDFFHNLCDGFFMGAAFRTCGVDFGWKVAIGTILHEIPQELADYVVLTGDAKVRPLIALVLNFLSGLSVLLGAILILSLGHWRRSDWSHLVLRWWCVFAPWGYWPHAQIYAQGLTKVQRALAFLAFIVGAVLIGLVLLTMSTVSQKALQGMAVMVMHTAMLTKRELQQTLGGCRAVTKRFQGRESPDAVKTTWRSQMQQFSWFLQRLQKHPIKLSLKSCQKRVLAALISRLVKSWNWDDPRKVWLTHFLSGYIVLFSAGSYLVHFFLLLRLLPKKSLVL